MEIETFDLVDSSVCEQIGLNDKNSRDISWFGSHFGPHSRFANAEISPKKFGNGGTHIKHKMEQIAYPKLPGFTPAMNLLGMIQTTLLTKDEVLLNKQRMLTM